MRLCKYGKSVLLLNSLRLLWEHSWEYFTRCFVGFSRICNIIVSVELMYFQSQIVIQDNWEWYEKVSFNSQPVNKFRLGHLPLFSLSMGSQSQKPCKNWSLCRSRYVSTEQWSLRISATECNKQFVVGEYCQNIYRAAKLRGRYSFAIHWDWK